MRLFSMIEVTCATLHMYLFSMSKPQMTCATDRGGISMIFISHPNAHTGLYYTWHVMIWGWVVALHTNPHIGAVWR